MGLLTNKVCPVVLRGKHQILMFRHPLAGVQLVKGTVEPGESAELAALRELAEESGICDARVVRSLGQSSAIAEGQLWHFFECQVDVLSEEWSHHAPDDGGRDFDFFWWPIADGPPPDCHAIFCRAIDHIRSLI